MNDISDMELGDLIQFQRGFDLPKSQFVAGKFPVVSSNGILGYHNEYKVRAPGITIGRSGTVGLPHYIEQDFFPHNTSLFVKEFKGNDPLYIFYLLKNLGLQSKKSGSGVPTMNRNHLHPLKIRAYKEEFDQKKIAAVLSALDSKIKLNNQINTELEAMAKTLYDYWFVQFDFPDENGKPYKLSGGKMIYNKTLKREIPEGWEDRVIGRIEEDIITGKTPPKTNPEYFDGDVPFITIGDIRGNIFVTDTEETLSRLGAEYQSNKYISKGAICVTCIASPGLVGIASDTSQTNQQINSIECANDKNKYYLFFAIKDFFRVSRAKTGNTFANMNKGDFSSIQLISPDKKVLEAYHLQVNSLFEILLNNCLENKKLAELRDWLLPMLMNGQVKVK